MQGGGVQTHEKDTDLQSKDIEIFLNGVEGYLDCFLKYSKRPDNKLDIEYGIDNVIECKLMGILTEKEYDKKIDVLLSVGNAIKEIGRGNNLSSIQGEFSTYVFKYKQLYYRTKTKTRETTRIFLEVDELEEELLSELSVKTYYDFDIKCVRNL